MKLTDDNGRLAPSIVALIIILAFVLGNITGAIGYYNWSLRGATDQLVDDMKVGTKIQKEKEVKLTALTNTIEDTDNDSRFSNESCLNYSNSEYARSLRNSSGDEE